jgi:Transposase DDE domain group 1
LRHLAFVTNREDDLHTVDSEHRRHAECQLAIRGLTDQALAHFPSGRFAANAAWTVIACLAHNLQRWSGMLGLEDPTPRTARTIRRWPLALPGRLTRTARRWTLHLPPRWSWRQALIEALTRTRALPATA